jgi:asparagine synthase (glutamine-hydrolysing)
MLEILPFIWDTMDEPFADASFLPTYLLSSFTKQFVTVSLSGDGGDEVFAGYPTYFAHKIARWIPSWSVSLFQYFSTLLPVNFDNISLDFKIKQFCKGLSFRDNLRHQYWLGSFNEKQKEKLYNPHFRERLICKDLLSDLISTHMLNNDAENNWEKHMYQDMRFYLQDNMLVKVDRSSMAHSLEVRVPYLDHHIVEFMSRVPARLKYKGYKSKYLLKKLGRKFLPDEIIDRPKKGFGIPVAKWFCGSLKMEINDIIVDPQSYINTYFNQTINSQLLDDHLIQKVDNRKLLWTLFVLENWLRHNRFSEE